VQCILNEVCRKEKMCEVLSLFVLFFFHKRFNTKVMCWKVSSTYNIKKLIHSIVVLNFCLCELCARGSKQIMYSFFFTLFVMIR